MSEAKIDETSIEPSFTENGDKEDAALANSVSDGEIVDDDEPEEQKADKINFSPRKCPKNFRTRNKNESDDEADGKILDLLTQSSFLLCKTFYDYMFSLGLLQLSERKASIRRCKS